MDKKTDIKNKILIVEDSLSFSKMLNKKIYDDLGIECDIAASFKETRIRVENYEEGYYMAILDLNLPDSSQGEVIDYILKQGIPAIVVTSELNDEIRDKITKKRILDYFVKSGDYILDQILNIILKLSSNQKKKILLVDDSKSSRFVLKTLLEVHKYNILEAENGKIALDILESEQDIKLVITDNQMPVMDGNELIVNIRKKYPKNVLAVIGISAYGSGIMSANYLKRGANDFITKPFVIEEFYQRINMNLEYLEHIEELRDASLKDSLTGIYNRRFFYSNGKAEFIRSIENMDHTSVIMLVIDQFKSINDEHGQDSGDKVIEKMISILQEEFPDEGDIIARIEGIMFSVLLFGKKIDKVKESLESFSAKFGKEQFGGQTKSFNCTVSIGLFDVKGGDFKTAVSKADDLLKQAKGSGTNQLVSG